MFYKYPEEFIVPIVYNKDLKLDLKDQNRGKKMRGNNSIEADYISLQESYQDHITSDNAVLDNLDDEKVKEIMNEIDNEYVISEVGII